MPDPNTGSTNAWRITSGVYRNVYSVEGVQTFEGQTHVRFAHDGGVYRLQPQDRCPHVHNSLFVYHEGSVVRAIGSYRRIGRIIWYGANRIGLHETTSRITYLTNLSRDQFRFLADKAGCVAHIVCNLEPNGRLGGGTIVLESRPQPTDVNRLIVWEDLLDDLNQLIETESYISMALSKHSRLCAAVVQELSGGTYA